MSEIKLDIPDITVLIDKGDEYRVIVNKPGSVVKNITGSYIIAADTAVTSSYALSASYIAGVGVESASYALTASFATNAVTNLPAGLLSSSTQILNYNIFTTTGSNTLIGNQIISGGLEVQNGITGSFKGDGSQLTGLVTDLRISGSVGSDTVSLLSDDLTITGQNGIRTTITNNTITINVPSALTASLLGTSSYAQNAITSSYVLPSGLPPGTVSSSTQISTGSLFGTASYANNSNLLDGLDSTIFATTGSNQFNGNQIITGSVTISGSALPELIVVGDTTLSGSLTVNTATSSSVIISGSITGSVSSSLLDMTTIWNTSGTPSAIKLNVTDNASNTNSLLMNLQTNQTSRFAVRKDGFIDTGGIGWSSTGIRLYVGNTNTLTINRAVAGYSELVTFYDASGTNAYININSDAQYRIGGDTILARDSASVFAQRNSTNPQAFRIYNTFTDASNFERARIAWSSNTLQIGTEQSGSGVARALELQTSGSTALTINTAQNVGIGTTTPTQKLEISLGSISTGGGPTTLGTLITADATANPGHAGHRITLNNSSANFAGFVRGVRTPSTTFIGFEIGTETNHGIRFLTNGTADAAEKVRIDSTGKVGIGTTNPVNTLQIQGNVSASSYTSSISNAVGFFGTASYAVNADTLDGLNSTVLATTGSNTFTGIQTISNTTNSTLFNNGALIVQGGVGIAKDVNISGSLTVLGLLTVVSMSTQFVTSSQLNVADNKITVQSNDLVRFGGLSVYDSGSTSPTTASIYWDSLNHKFLYENLSGSAYNSAIFIAGPQNTGTLGNEVGLTAGRVPVASGDDHIDSRPVSSSIRVDFPSRLTHIEAGLYITGSITASEAISASQGLTGSLFGTASWAQNATTASALNGGTTNYIPLWTSATVQSSSVIFQSGSSIGIGTSNPNYPLQVRRAGGAGSLGISIDNVGSTDRTVQYFSIQDSAAGLGAGHAFYYRAPSSTTDTLGILLDEGGRVGIGTTNPTNTLQIQGNVSASSYTSSISNAVGFFGTASWASNAISSSFAPVGPGTSQSIALFNSSNTISSSVIFQSASNIGINDSSPTDSLVVSGRIRLNATNKLAFGSSQGGYADISITGSTQGTMLFRTWDGSAFVERMRIESASGNIGIGTTSPQTKLDVNGEIAIGGAAFLTSSAVYNIIRRRDGGVGIYLGGSDTSNYYDNSGHHFRDRNSNTRMYIAASTTGNVGIGTISPVNTLQIQGNVSASSYTSSISNAVGFFGTASWAQNATSASAATSITFTPATASLALAVSGSANCVLYNNAVNTTTTSANLVFDGTNLTVGGQLNAATKSFLIDHRTKPGKKLVYGVTEGPEHSVFIRGKLDNTNIITLPEEWEWLVDMNSITVQLTSIGKHQKLYVKEINERYITIENGNWFSGNVHCYYLVHATRKDVPPLQTVV